MWYRPGAATTTCSSNVVHYTFTATQINAAFPDSVAADMNPLHNVADYDGLTDFTVSRDKLLMLFSNITPNPSFTQAQRITYLLGWEWDIVQPGGTLNIFVDEDLHHEALPSNNAKAADVVMHATIDVIRRPVRAEPGHHPVALPRPRPDPGPVVQHPGAPDSGE